MKDKEMQIKEMQKIMEYCCNVYDDKGRHIRNKCNTFDCEYYCDTNDVCCSFSKKEATALYDAGYRKLPEDSIVLSKEEYEKLKHFEYRVRSGVCMTQKEWFDFCNEDSNRRTCLRIEEREKERKETAEKILQAVKELFDSAGQVCDNPYTREPVWGYDTKQLDNGLNILAKQFGVEIKE